MEDFSETRGFVYEKIGRIALAIASPQRLKLIQLLAQAPWSVEVLSEMTGESIANTSQHLQKLLREGLVKVRKNGVNRIYELKSPYLLDLWVNLQDLAHAVAPELDDAEDELTDKKLEAPFSASEIIKKVRRKKAVLIDARDKWESEMTPVKAALAIPLKELSKRFHELPQGIPIIVLCRGRYCAIASHSVRLLRTKGFEAYRIREAAFQINQLWENL